MGSTTYKVAEMGARGISGITISVEDLRGPIFQFDSERSEMNFVQSISSPLARKQTSSPSTMPSVGESQPATNETPASRKCTGCDKPAGSLQCPKCLQLNIQNSYFCDQDCFKRNWVWFACLSV